MDRREVVDSRRAVRRRPGARRSLLACSFLLALVAWLPAQPVAPAPFSQLQVDGYFFQLIFRSASSATVNDLDGDGYADVAFTRFLDDKVLVSLGSPSGFGPIMTFGNVMPEPTWGDSRIKAGDLNGDGTLDLVVGFETGLTSGGASRLAYLIGLGNGTFTQGFPLATGNVLTGTTFQLADLDGDGDVEVVFLDDNRPGLGTTGTQTLTVFDWQGGTPQIVQSLPIATLPVIYAISDHPVIGDLTGDGMADLLLIRFPQFGVPTLSDVAILPGVAPLSFSATPIMRPISVLLSSRAGPSSNWPTIFPPQLMDVDQDGLLDVFLPGGFWFRQVPGSGVSHVAQPFPALPPAPTFTTPPSNPARFGVLYFEDFTGDGVKDLVTYTTQSGWPIDWAYAAGDDIALHMREGTGDGTWSPFRSSLVISQTMHQFLVFADRPGDVDGDGDLDIVMVGLIDGPQSAQVFGPGNAAIDTFVGRFDNLTFTGGGCAPGGGGGLPVITAPRAFTGNAGFTIRVDGGQATAMPGFLGFSSTQIPPALPCGAAIDLSPQAGFLLPAPLDASGQAVIPIPIPQDPVLWGLQVSLQWGGLPPGGGVAMSHVRNIVIW